MDNGIQWFKEELDSQDYPKVILGEIAIHN